MNHDSEQRTADSKAIRASMRLPGEYADLWAENLRLYRNRCHLTQAQLGRLVNVSRVVINQLENREHTISEPVRKAIAHVLKADQREIFPEPGTVEIGLSYGIDEAVAA